MDKRPLIVGSLCAVVLLVLGSLSNVMGYQSVKSIDSDSPLFNVRTQRATNQQQNRIASEYVGMGEVTNVHFPIRDESTELLKRAIELISKMDVRSYEQLMGLCVQKIKKDNVNRNHKVSDIIKLFRQLKTQPEIITDSIIPTRNNTLFTSPLPTPSLCYWEPGCIFWIILVSFGILILRLLTVKNFCAYTSSIDC